MRCGLKIPVETRGPRRCIIDDQERGSVACGEAFESAAAVALVLARRLPKASLTRASDDPLPDLSSPPPVYEIVHLLQSSSGGKRFCNWFRTMGLT